MQTVKSLPQNYETRSIGDVTFVDPAKPEHEILAERMDVYTHGNCSAILSGSGDVPDLIVDTMEPNPKKIISIAYRPLVKDCNAVSAVISQLLGSPKALNKEGAEKKKSGSGLAIKHCMIARPDPRLCCVPADAIERVR